MSQLFADIAEAGTGRVRAKPTFADLKAETQVPQVLQQLHDRDGLDYLTIGGMFSELEQRLPAAGMERRLALVQGAAKQLVAESEGMSITAAPTPGFWERFLVPENTQLPPWSMSTRREKAEHVLKAVTGIPTRIVMGLYSIPTNAAWAIVKRATPAEKMGEYENLTLEEAVNKMSGENPSGLEQVATGLAEFVGPAKVLGPVLSRVLPTGSGIVEGMKLFGSIEAANQAGKRVAEMIDPGDAQYGYEGAIAVMEQMGLGGALGKIQATELPEIAKTAMESVLFGGAAAVQGASPEEIAVQGLVPVVFKGRAAFRRKVMAEAVREYGEEIVRRNPEAAPQVVAQVSKTVADIEAGKFDAAKEARGGKPETGEPAGVAEPAAVAGSPEAAAEGVSAEQRLLWDRLQAPEGFKAANADEVALKQLYDEGLLRRPEDVAEVLQPGSTTGRPETLSPSSQVTALRMEEMLSYMSQDGRAAVNSREASNWVKDLASDRARDATEHPDVYVDRVMQTGEDLHHEEAAGLLRYQAILRGKQQELMRRQLANPADPVNKALDREYDDLQTQIDRVGGALVLGGSESGRRLNIQKLALDENLNPVWVKSRAERNKGAKLEEKEDARLDKLMAENAALRKERDAQRAAHELENLEREARRPVREKTGDKGRTREQRLRDNMAKLKELLEAGC